MCPRGVYERTGKITKEQIKDFVKFCFREDIAKELKQYFRQNCLQYSFYKFINFTNSSLFEG